MTKFDDSIPKEIIKAMSTDEGGVSEGFEDEDVFFYAQHANQNAIRYVSHHAYQNNKRSNAAKSSGEHQEMNLSYKRASMGSNYAGKKSTIIWTSALRKKFVEAVEKLGIDNAVPRKIVELMKVDGLTRDHVASYLQKYRITLKKLANKNDGAETSSKPSLLESSMANDGASWNNSSLMHNQEQMNWPSYSGTHTTNPSILNTSSSCFPFLEASNVNATLPSELIYSSSLPNQGYSMEAMGNNLDEQRNFIYDTTSMGHVVNSMNSSNSGFMPNLDGFFYNYGGCSTEVHPYNNIELGLSSGVNMNKDLAMSWNQENPINIANFSNASFVENSNGLGSYYSHQSEFDEMGYLYDSTSNGNLQNAIGKDNLVMTEADMTSFLSYADVNGEYGGTSNNIPVTLDPLNQDLNACNFQDIVSIDPNNNEETPSVNQLQTLDGYLPAFDPTYIMLNTSLYPKELNEDQSEIANRRYLKQDLNEQFMEPIWSLGTLANDMTHQGLILDSNVQDE